MNSTSDCNQISRRRNSLHYWKVVPEDDFTRELVTLMAEAGMNYADLARKVGVSRSYVTKIMQGSANWTVETLTKFALVFDRVPRIHLAPKEQRVTWSEIPLNPEKTADAVTYERLQDNIAVYKQRSYAAASAVSPMSDGDLTGSIVWVEERKIANG